MSSQFHDMAVLFSRKASPVSTEEKQVWVETRKIPPATRNRTLSVL